MKCLMKELFGFGNFASKRNTSPHDATRCGGVRIEIFEVSSRISLAYVRCERASILSRLVAGESESEIVVAVTVRTKCRVGVRWRNINWCS